MKYPDDMALQDCPLSAAAKRMLQVQQTKGRIYTVGDVRSAIAGGNLRKWKGVGAGVAAELKKLTKEGS